MASMIFTLIVPPFSCFGESRRSLTTKHTDFLLNFVSLWMLFQMARCEGIVSIDCEKSGSSFCRTMDQVCSGHCSDSCVDGPRSSRPVWGASIYTYDSSVCKSAIHDRRISTWDTEKRNFVLKRTRDYKNYWNSDRFGIRTISHLQLYNRTHGSFIFENPRIEEEILDVASVHSMFLIPQSSSHVQSCYVATNRKVSFRNDSNPQSKSFVGTTIVLEPSLFRYTKTWSVASDNGFLCIPEKTMLSIITSVAMRSDAYFLPTSLTYIANVNDSVTLSMNKKHEGLCTTIWRKDGKALPEFISSSKVGKTSLTLDSVEEGSQGLYSLQCNSDPDRRGIMRLIVRACPKDKYGDKCIAECPECKNGGVCHDITGVCICPPGFNGTLCQDACPPDYFGQACSMTCESGGTSCQGKLICLPDPYGCSCGSGYKGISCDETCASGEFGVGCSQKRECHCSNGQPCDAHSGLCSSGCQGGWHGDGCAISYPVLTEVPILVNSSKNSLTLSFREWDSKLDKGSGTPLTYTIHFMEKVESGASTEWKSKNASPFQDALKQQIVVTLDELKPGTVYAVKVEIIDKSGGSQREGLKASEFTTLCDKPQEPPTNINLSATEDKVFIGWDMPPKSSWNCKSVEVVVKYNNYSFSTQEILLNSRHSYEFSSSPFTSWNVFVCLRPEGVVSADGTCSEEQVVRTKEVAPGIVNGFSHRSVSSRSVALEWRQPAETNGVIRYFILRYQQTGWKHPCSDLYDDSVEVLNVSSWHHKVTNLNPSSKYLFSLSAFTVKEGPSLNLSIETKTDVPSAAPRHLTLSDGYKSLTWEEPPCSVTNGRIKDYLITMTSLNEWDKMKIKEITNEKKFDLPSTIPYTKYDLKVSASTEAGIANTCARYDFETESGDPPTPRNFRIYSQNRNSFYLAWLPPHPPHGRLSKYEIRYKIKGSQGWKEVADISPTNCSADQLKQYHCYTLTNLEQNETFSIQIKAFNEGLHSGSKYSEEITGLTTELIPGPPSPTTAPERNESSITIRWETPVIKNGILLNYRVNMSLAKSYSSLADESSFKNGTEIIPASERQCTFTNLWPATIYNFTIEARTAAGYGPALTTSLTTSIRVPVIDREPEFINKTLNSITIKIFPVTPKGGPISAYFVIVKTLPTRTRTKRYVKDFFTPRNCKVLMDSEQRHIVARIRDVPVSGKVFTVGDGKCREGYYNQPLTSEIYYRIGIAVLSQYDKEEKYSEIKYVSAEEDIFVGQHVETSDTYGTVLGILIFLIVVISVLTFIFFKKPHLFSKAKKKVSRTLRLIPATDRNLDFSYANAIAEHDDFIETESLSEDVNCLILVKDLEDFVLRGSRNGEIKRQHRALPRGQKFACHISKIPENRVKNRYGNLLPYDHTRVILKTIPGVPHSDYINANYVSGYKKAKKYIATQGPIPKTVNDFWRMVWKEKSCKILMATNLFEGGRVKCDKYWPDDTDTFGSITVTLKSSQPLADYVIRTYEITQGKEKRELKHFHFLTWPDHGVPMYASPVVKFLKKTRDYKPESKTPVIVHCSAGVGRTGTLILLDSMMEMGVAEGRVDVCGHLSVMRRERNNIVENLEQFVFVYKALVQYLCWEETVVLCSDLIPQIGKLRTPDSNTYFTPLEMQYQRLSKICPQLDNAAVRIARDPANVPKNRTMRILPPERARPFIKPRPGEEGIPYINAVYVNGYKEKDAFLVTQFPLPCTITDFWQMIRDTKSQTIVLLQDIDFKNPTCPRYWPCEGETMVYGEFQVQCSLKELYGGFYIWRLSLSTLNSDDDSAVPVALFHHFSWAANQSLPQHPNSILDLIEAVENAQKQCGKHSITVQCLDGSTACGLFCAAAFMLGKMINDQEVDAFLAVQNSRVNRPQFIESFEQYDFLYSLAVSFLDNFGTYANFL